MAWRVVGVTYADGVHAYFLLGGRTRAGIAVNTLGVLAALVAELVALTFAANALAGLAGFGGQLAEVTPAQVAGAVALHAAALVPLLNYAVLTALAARLHAPRVPLLVAAVCLPLAIGLLDTVTPTKYGGLPWGRWPSSRRFPPPTRPSGPRSPSRSAGWGCSSRSSSGPVRADAEATRSPGAEPSLDVDRPALEEERAIRRPGHRGSDQNRSRARARRGRG